MEKEKIELNYVDRQRSEEGRYQEIGGGRLDRRKPTSATRLGNFWKIWETKNSYKIAQLIGPFGVILKSDICQLKLLWQFWAPFIKNCASHY